jgi:drug/metabolite transporter (DMT)-like permease
VVIKAMGRPLLGEGWRNRFGSFAIMAITSGCYFMNTLGAVRAAGVTLLVFWGVLLLREGLSLTIVVGMLVILVGIRKPAVERDSAAA